MATPFEQLLVEHGPMVLRVCRALVGPDDAEDAWSETFISALEAYPRLRPDSNVRGWLVTIAHRKAIDQLRARSRRPTPTGDLADRPARDGLAGSFPDDRADDLAVGLAVDRDTDLWDALAVLPFKQRGAVAYHHLAGLPYAEVGPLLGSSEAAARRSAADGLANLRRAYAPTNPRRTGPRS